MRSTPHFPNLPGWNLAIRLFNVISRTLIVEGVLPLCRDAISVFFSASWMDFNPVIWHQVFLSKTNRSIWTMEESIKVTATPGKIYLDVMSICWLLFSVLSLRKHSYLLLCAIVSWKVYLFTQFYQIWIIFKQIHLNHRRNVNKNNWSESEWTREKRSWWGTPHSPDLQN